MLRHTEAMVTYQLIYRSRISRRIRFADAEKIAERSAEKNALRNISGMLLYTPTHFLQVLEGEKATVLRLFERISSDDRHSEVAIISQGEVDERCFGDWGMRVVMPRESVRPESLEKLDGEGTLALLMAAR